MNRSAANEVSVIAVASLLSLIVFAPAPAQAPPADPLVTIDFPDDGIDITLLADIVTRRLKVPILYDESMRGKKVIIRVPTKVPESSLMGILQSALRAKQLALVDAEQPGWKQIVAAPNLAAVASLPDAANAGDGPLTQAFVLEHADPTKIAELVRPTLTQPGGTVTATAGGKLLLVSDYASVVRRAEQLIKRLDSGAPAVETRFVPLAHAEAAATAPAVTQLITNRDNAQWGSPAASGISVTADERSNQLVVVAPPPRMDEVVGLINGFDKSPDTSTTVYRLKTLTPERVDQIVRGLLDPGMLKRGYQAGVDRDSQSLAVTATVEVHEKVARLIQDLDVPTPQSANPIQFYKLKNTKAADVLSTISGLLGDGTQPQPNAGQSSSQPPAFASRDSVANNANATAAAPGNTPLSAAEANRPSSLADNRTPIARTGLAGGAGGSGGAADALNTAPTIGGLSDRNAASPGTLSVRSKDATVAADVNTNSIIVIGPPAVQQSYSDLIKRLDQRRPQVQIECTIVTLDTTDNFSFGVDVGKLGGFGNNQLLTLSSFGVSTADPATGRLTPTAGVGGTFALLSPGIADVVLRALQTNSNARLVSAPQLLVNDNGLGKLESVSQQPYAVILDASSVQSITSLGGLASAGTSISVEPHISEADYLQLGYSIELSSFTGTSSNGLPPPSQKNSVDSEVTIPDGYTIVVGGLTTNSSVKGRNTVPLLGDIPVLGWIFGTHNNDMRSSTLFVFIKPVILRDDKFEDLKYLSGRARLAVGVADDFPTSKPIALR